jgi:uncharacterized protein
VTISAIDLPMGKIAEFCDRWQVTEFALFGSVLRNDFRSDSDIDVMVQFHPDAHPTFRNLDQMEAELKTTFHRDIDLITCHTILLFECAKGVSPPSIGGPGGPKLRRIYLVNWYQGIETNRNYLRRQEILFSDSPWDASPH